jgi:hypothetical protein
VLLLLLLLLLLPSAAAAAADPFLKRSPCSLGGSATARLAAPITRHHESANLRVCEQKHVAAATATAAAAVATATATAAATRHVTVQAAIVSLLVRMVLAAAAVAVAAKKMTCKVLLPLCRGKVLLFVGTMCCNLGRPKTQQQATCDETAAA